MNGLKISFAVVAFVLVQGIGVIWYVSKLDSRVDQMYKSFEEENKKEVIENQVKMKLDLENLIADVKTCLLYTSPSPRDRQKSRMPSSA